MKLPKYKFKGEFNGIRYNFDDLRFILSEENKGDWYFTEKYKKYLCLNDNRIVMHCYGRFLPPLGDAVKDRTKKLIGHWHGHSK